MLTPQGGGETLRVPYAGFKGDYQITQVLTPTANGFPWLAQLVGTSYFNRPNRRDVSRWSATTSRSSCCTSTTTRGK